MGLIKWIKRELDSSNSCKRRQSEPPLSGGINEQLPRDESYVKALSKFNEWRRRQHIGGSVRLTRKQSKKLIERRGQSEQFFEKRYPSSNDTIALQSKNIKPLENGLYEEIQVNKLKREKNSPRRNLYEKTSSTNRSFPVTESIKTKRRTSTSSNKSNDNDTQIYENVIIDIIDQFDQSPDILEISQRYLSPPVKFFKENSNPFANIHTPTREQHQDIEQFNRQNDDVWTYESPRNIKNLEALRANFKPFEVNESRVRTSISSDCRSSRNPPYQTVINRNGEEVEYALPLNEKLDEEVEIRHFDSDSRTIALNNTSSYQQYIEDNFQFLNENDRLGLSRVSVSFSNNQFQNGSVLVTDLDGTCGTKAYCDQNNTKERNTVEELEAIQVWSRNISQNIERNIIKKTPPDMQFGEIIVCNTNEVSEKTPRQVFETFNGTLHSGTFHCVPVTQFKPKFGAFSESNFQLNYEVLRKIRHPDIVLLMGITVDNKCTLDSLILEPVDYSLHHFIHQEFGCIPISICLLYTLQINSAITYLHKHGLIHSNISTHSVVMCHLSKAVKLTSFELTTTTNEDLRNELMEVFQNEKYENELPTNINQLPSKLRPYNIEYRKMFSKHNHQAPELLSNRIGFVFPTIQSDVYGICLMLWEMINCSIPFAYFDYDEMAKLVYLQNAQLPMLKENRQKPFDEVLKLGLNMLAEKRFADTIELKEALSAVSIESDDKIDSSNEEEKMISKKQPLDGVSSLLYNKGFGPLISERTSTIKKRKHIFKEDRLSAKQLFVYSQINKSNDPSDGLISSHTSSPDSSQYGFDIGEVSIPETPIARSNKLRKTAWLSNQSISPIVHLEIKSKDDDAAINQIEIVEKNTYNALKSEEDTSSNKLYNVNIRIRPNSKKPRTPISNKEDDISQPPIENNSLDQAHKNISQISDYIKFFNLVSKQNPQPIVHSPTKTQSPVENLVNYNTITSKPTQTTEKMLNQQPEPVPMDQNSLNEFFSRSHATSDFENSLWRREKQKCDQSVRSQRRISVKDAVNKFESFSKSIISESNSPKLKRSTAYSATSNTDEKKKFNSNLQSPKNDDCEKNISKINIVLQNKSESIKSNGEKFETQMTKTKEECNVPDTPEQPNQSPMLTLNFKKLDRRASDVGSYYIRQNSTTKALTARHSIYGSEIFKRLRKPKASTVNENENEEIGEKKANKSILNTNIFHDKNKDFKIKVGKLTCMNCGHKLFVVDDIVHSNNEEDLNETFSELLLTPLKRNFGLQQQVSKSTEDFYIDDDFCEDFELCANMELGTQTQLSDFDFDIFSAEIFNASEEKTSHIA